MQSFNLFIIVFFMTFAWSQETQSVQSEIDQTLWKPFKAAFENGDGKALNSLYAEQVLRVTPDGIDTENQFKNANLRRFENNKISGTTIRLDFWFDSRKTNAATSYEVGFYRMKLVSAAGEKTIFGQFHIVLKKLDGRWQITQDWDTTTINGNSIGAKDFEGHKPLKFD